MKYLILWEIAKKQDYIFRSNKIKECVGASNIIKNLSESLGKNELKESNFIVKGGGKIIYWFEDEEERTKFIKNKSRNVLNKYPGLDIFMVTYDYDESAVENSTIKEAINELYKKLDMKKRKREYYSCQVGYGIEEKCSSTGNPAYIRTTDEEKRYISRECWAKINNEKNYSDNKWLRELDDMTVEGEKSFIAIVHIDGNGMGRKIEAINKSIVKSKNESIEQFNKRYIKTIKSFSKAIERANNNAFDYLCEVIKDNRDILNDITKVDEDKLPIRPLIMAGDDITFICNGCIGIECARIFIEKLSEENINIEGITDPEVTKLTACAGIAIVKKNYPFMKAYEMAESLCENSKRFLKEDKMKYSALDFHISQGEINGDIDGIRREKYNLGKLILTMKPFCLGNSSGRKEYKWRSYDNFIKSLDNVRESIKQNKVNEKIGITRSKVKQLKNIFKKGENEVKKFFSFYDVNTKSVFPALDETNGDFCFYKNKGNDWCMYLDAIECMDIFINLNNDDRK